MIDSITDPEIRALDPGIGSVEQVTDNVTVLTTSGLRAAAPPILGPTT